MPARIVIDNAKCAITRACRTDPLVQRAYAECAEGYGFRIDACPPGEPQLKGIVEAGVKYVKGNFVLAHALYSAPFALVGRRLWLRATDASVALYEDYRHVATHARALRAGERRTVRDHLPPDAARFLAHDRGWCEEQAVRIGQACATLVGRLLADRILERLRASLRQSGRIRS